MRLFSALGNELRYDEPLEMVGIFFNIYKPW